MCWLISDKACKETHRSTRHVNFHQAPTIALKRQATGVKADALADQPCTQHTSLLCSGKKSIEKERQFTETDSGLKYIRKK
jgi:hypothetical protein